MKIKGLDKNNNIRIIEKRQEKFHIGKSIYDALEGKTDLNTYDPKDYVNGLEYYFIDGEPTTKEEAEKLFDEIKLLDCKLTN